MKESQHNFAQSTRDSTIEAAPSRHSGKPGTKRPQLHAAPPRKKDLLFPVLRPGGHRQQWLSKIRDYLGVDSITLTSVHSHASGSRDPYSSLESKTEIASLVKFVLGKLAIEKVSEHPSSQWIESSLDSRYLYAALIPATELDKASLVIVGMPEEAVGAQLEKLVLTATLTAKEARLVLETERRTSAEEMFYHSQKLNCMGQLAGGIAHDFNNLLTVIQGHTGFVEMAAQEWNDPKVTESIELIQNATYQSVGLVKQLLLFSRDQKASFETLDLNVVVDDFSKMIRRMVEETIGLRLELDRNADCIRADKGMLSQVLMNLVVNARDAMPGGGEILIKTSYRPEAEDGSHHPCVLLTITDTGCGIPKDKLSRIFDPFYTTKPKGTGLGLANVAGLLRQHSGVIDVSSEPGKGTEVEILFPAVKGSARKRPEPAIKELPAEKQSISGSRVLLVEDESAVRKLVRKLLEMNGCSVIEARSGKEALELWPEISDEISVVVTDVVMPEGVSGWDLAKQLHRLRPELGILLTSGYNEKLVDHGLGDAPNIAFLQKPYEATKLKSDLFELIRDREIS